MAVLALSRHSRIMAGILLLSLIGVEAGGRYLVGVSAGDVAVTDFQENFQRAGHAHAGMLVTLGLVGLVLADATRLRGFPGYLARHAIPIGALLMSGGFFLSSMGDGRTEPNGFIALLWIGGVVLTVGIAVLGGALLIGGLRSASAGGSARADSPRTEAADDRAPAAA